MDKNIAQRQQGLILEHIIKSLTLSWNNRENTTAKPETKNS